MASTENLYDFVFPNLAVGEVAARSDPRFVAVVSLLSSAPWDEWYKAPAVPAGTPLHKVDIRDGDLGLEEYLDGIVAFVREHIRRGPVLVHCGRGLSRSATAAAACIVDLYRLPPDAAEWLVKIGRRQVDVAARFAYTLRDWAARKQRERAGGVLSPKSEPTVDAN